MQVEGNELRVSSDLVCSRVLEKLVRFCSSEDVHRLMRGFVPIVDRMLLNRHASHVLQAIIPRAVSFLEPDDVRTHPFEAPQLHTNPALPRVWDGCTPTLHCQAFVTVVEHACLSFNKKECSLLCALLCDYGNGSCCGKTNSANADTNITRTDWH